MKKIIISISILSMVLTGCRKDWDEHYNNPPETIDKNMWDVIKEDPEFSTYVQYMEEFEFDTLFKGNSTYTLFIPDNDAFTDFLVSDTVNISILNYLISAHFVQSGSINGSVKIQMLAEKYVQFDNQNNTSLFDGIPLEQESPLYANGKYYVIGEVAKPRPNLFEYFSENNPVLKAYILGLDSIILNKEESRPIGFDEDGNTIYDTVSIIYNEFEDFYFPIREEFRYKTATMVFPKAEDYNSALNEMATTLGGDFHDYKDIPLIWQNDVLIPYLLEHGVFENSLSETDFIKTGLPTDSLRLKNILGDSIEVDYEVTDKFICSNGVTFNYESFKVPDTLFKGSTRLEAELLLFETGVDKFSWDTRYTTVTTSGTFSPYQEYVPSASGDSIIRVIFPNNYSGTFELEVNITNIFPRKYLMVVRTLVNVGGIFDVYFNGDLVKTVDYNDYYTNPNYYWSVVTGLRYFPEKQGFHHWDAWAINDRPYGKAKLRFVYKGPSSLVPKAGLVMDYIDFIPYND